ncbi:MAG: decarboxylase [Marmoricola sp.]
MSPGDPRGLRAHAPLLDAWLSFMETPGHPFTIPGHKQSTEFVGDVVRGDVPLYAGLDSMKLSYGRLADAQARAARLWGATSCHFSVGGSTHGNQALAMAMARPGDMIVLSRTSHRSMVSALVLADLVPQWLVPTVSPDGMPLPPTGADVAAALAGSAAVGVHLTDPAYVGTCGDVSAWATACRGAGVPLVIDAAWAAHFGFHPALPPHALAAGADALVTSAHKTLPSWSQGALILAGAGFPAGRLDMAVDAIHTTSPVSAILASIDAARALLETAGEALLGDVLAAVGDARSRLAQVDGLRVLDGPGVDPLKLTLVLGHAGADGNLIEADLIAAGMPVELADRDTIVAMVTMADQPGDIDRLVTALIGSIERHRGMPRSPTPSAAYSVVPELALTPKEAFFAPTQTVPLRESVGRVGAELIAPYPPGIPVLAPGERITAEVVDALLAAQVSGIRIAYAADSTLASVKVVK